MEWIGRGRNRSSSTADEITNGFSPGQESGVRKRRFFSGEETRRRVMWMRIRLQNGEVPPLTLFGVLLVTLALIWAGEKIRIVQPVPMSQDGGVPSALTLAFFGDPIGVSSGTFGSAGIHLYAIREFARTCCDEGPRAFRAPSWLEYRTKRFGNGERGILDYAFARKRFLMHWEGSKNRAKAIRVFVPVAMFDEFLEEFFLRLPEEARVVVVSGQEDCGPAELFGYGRSKCRLAMPVTLRDFILDLRLVRWFTQNYDFVDCEKIEAFPENCLHADLPEEALRKVSPIPIGLDYHTDAEKALRLVQKTPAEQEHQLTEIADTRWNEKPPRVIAVFSVSSDKPDRVHLQAIVDTMNKECVFRPSMRVEKQHLWEKHQDNAFVLCPQGNGIDTHRVWEALQLGSVPVVRSSPLDSLYGQFPIVILDEWEELKSCEVLAEWKQQIVDRFGSEPFHSDQVKKKLGLQYWIDKVKAASFSLT